jgi:hypothetical protein
MKHTSAAGEHGRTLLAASYDRQKQAFRDCPDPVYRLRAPWIAPCALGELHTVNGALQAVTLIYGPWDTGQPHIRVTTWRDLPGQDFTPGVPAGLLAARPEQAVAGIEGSAAVGTLVRLPTTAWLLRVDRAHLHLVACGRGLIGELSFVPLTDLEPVLAARRAHLETARPQG